MEFINSVEIRGIVGTSESYTYKDKTAVCVTVVTEYGYIDKKGMPVIDTTWFIVLKWQDSDNPAVPKKGDWVHARGRMRHRHYTDKDGNDRIPYEVVASELEIIPKEQ